MICMLLLISSITFAASDAAKELAMKRQWVADHWLAMPKAVAPETAPQYPNGWLEVLANNGPLQMNSRSGKPLKIGETEYTRGLYCHAVSDVIVHLPAPGKAFSALVGVDANNAPDAKGSVVFSVSVGGAVAVKTPVLHGKTAAVPVAVDLQNATQFVLEIGDSGDGIAYDQSDWADAKVMLADGRELWLGELPVNDKRDDLPAHPGTLPFYFRYDDTSSDYLLPQWTRALKTEEVDANRVRHTLTFTDPKTGLEVRGEATEYRDLPVIEWVLHFTNTGKADTPILSGIHALDVPLAGTGHGFVLHHALGESNSARSFASVDDGFGPQTYRSYVPRGGRSSDGQMPYFNVDWHDGGMALAIGWAGQWGAGFASLSDKSLRAIVGLERTHFLLHPGESVRMPRIVLTFWDGDDDLRGNNLFRRYILKYNTPQRGGKPVFAPICASIGVAAKDGSYEKPHLDAISVYPERGIEVFWSDMDPQQWYPGGFPNGTGTWEVDTKKYPHGLKPLGDAIKAGGMGYLLWYEPERVHPGSKIDKTHPEWVMPRQGEWSQLFKLHDPAARKWLTDYIDTTITEANLAWLRWDFNIEPLGFWRRNDTTDRQGITEIQYVEGLYAMWDELQRRHPGLLIDVCSSGGRRLDIDTLRYGIPLWHSDLQCEPYGKGRHTAAANQMQNVALFRWVPFHGCLDLGQEPSYDFRSAMTSGNIMDGFGTAIDGEERAKATEAVKRTVAIYKKLRPYMLGDFYPLFPHDDREQVWFGYQYHRPEQKDGYAMIYRRAQCADAQQTVHLRGLTPDATYEVSFEDTPGTQRVTGKDLAAFVVNVPTQPGSAVLYYHMVPAAK